MRLVEDGEVLTLAGEEYQVIWVPGHSDGQIVLFRACDGVLLAADHVLPRITPNVGLYSPDDRQNPLGDYLDSLAKVEHLPATLVLPGHRDPFPDLAKRVRELIEHHDERANQILQLIAEEPHHAAWLTERLFQRRLTSDETRRMAMAEVLAHLEYLRLIDRVTQVHTPDGLILYQPV